MISIRSPGPIAPRDVHCELFELTYSRIAADGSGKTNYLDTKVDDSIDNFLRSHLYQIGPELLSGCLTVSFFERRASRQLFGFIPSHEEKVIWEQWIMHIVLNNTPRPMNDDSASLIERQRIQSTAEGMLKSVMLKIYDLAGNDIDHIPPVMYDFEIKCTKRIDDRENMYSRVANMPSLLNLDGS